MLVGGLEGPRQKLVEFRVEVAVDDLCDDAGEIGVRFDLAQFAGFDQGSDDRPMLGSPSSPQRARSSD